MMGGNDAVAIDRLAGGPLDNTPMACKCCGPTRRTLLHGAIVVAVDLAVAPLAFAETAAKDARPRAGDRFVFATGEKQGQEITPADLPEGGPETLAWPMDPATKTVRDGSRLNQVLLIRLAPTSLAGDTLSHAADGVLAYSAICTHAQCPVTAWNAEKGVLRCPCHNSEYDPRLGGKVVFGPAPRALPTLPVKIDDGALVVAGPFLSRVGNQPA